MLVQTYARNSVGGGVKTFELESAFRPPAFGCNRCVHFAYGGVLKKWHKGHVLTQYMLDLVHEHVHDDILVQCVFPPDFVGWLKRSIDAQSKATVFLDTMEVVLHKTLVVTHDDCAVVHRHMDTWDATLRDNDELYYDFFDLSMSPPAGRLSPVLECCFAKDATALTVKMMRGMRAGDKLVTCHIEAHWAVDDELGDACELDVVILVPPAPWVRARRAWKLRALVFFWLGRTQTAVCAPGGTGRAADKRKFEECFGDASQKKRILTANLSPSRPRKSRGRRAT